MSGVTTRDRAHWMRTVHHFIPWVFTEASKMAATCYREGRVWRGYGDGLDVDFMSPAVHEDRSVAMTSQAEAYWLGSAGWGCRAAESRKRNLR